MSPQEEILTTIKDVIETSTNLNTLLGGVPNVFYMNADENTACPYFTYRIDKISSKDSIIWTAELKISQWFYSNNNADALSAEDYIVRAFNKKIINGTNVKACRLWLNSEGRTYDLKKDHVFDYDVIFIQNSFYMRWSVATRNADAEF